MRKIKGICEICRQGFEDGDELFICPECTQDFHFDHFVTWYDNSKQCPVCSKSFKSTHLFVEDNFRIFGESKQESKSDVNFEPDLTFETEFRELVTVKVKNDQLIYTHTVIPFSIKYLIKMRWYFAISLALYVLVRGLLILPTSDYGLPLVISGIMLLVLYLIKRDELFEPLYNIINEPDEVVTIIGKRLETNLSRKDIKVIDTRDVLHIRIYKNEMNQKFYFPGLRIYGGEEFIFGDAYTFQLRYNTDRMIRLLSEFLGKSFEVYNFVSTDYPKSSINQSFMFQYSKTGYGEILVMLFSLVAFILLSLVLTGFQILFLLKYTIVREIVVFAFFISLLTIILRSIVIYAGL